VFWSTIAFHVAQGPVGGGSATVGLLGLLGLAGVVVAPLAGRLAMRVAPLRVNLGALAVVAGSFVVLAVAPGSLVMLGVGVVLLDAGVQANHLTNQTVIYGLAPEAHSRINAIYMVSYFLGGALGTAVAAQAWQLGGWPAVCLAGGGFAALAIWRLRQRSAAPAHRGGPAREADEDRRRLASMMCAIRMQ